MHSLKKATAVFAVIGAIFLLLMIASYVWRRFGKKGALTMAGIGLAVILSLAGAYISERIKDADWLALRAAAVNDNVELLRAVVKEKSAAAEGFGDACAKLRFRHGIHAAGISMVRSGPNATLHVIMSGLGRHDGPFDIAAGPVLEDAALLDELPSGLETALTPEVFLVPSSGTVRPGAMKGENEWVGTMIAIKPDSRERCTGTLVVSSRGATVTDDRLLRGAIDAASWTDD